MQDFSTFSSTLFPLVLSTLRLSTSLTNSPSYISERYSNDTFSQVCQGIDLQVMGMCEGVGIKDMMDLVEFNDDRIESVDMVLDEMSGKTFSAKVVPKTDFMAKGNKNSQMFHADIPRPQDMWAHTFDNSKDPFVPRLTKKPNAKVPLNNTLLTDTGTDIPSQLQAHLSDKLGIATNGERKPDFYDHPYKEELNTLTYLPEHLSANEVQEYQPYQSTPFKYIQTVEELNELKEILDKQTEIAIDLEHHSYRTYLGFTCLIQISTREEDFIIDTIELREELECLNSSFTNPAITKVLHGSNSDILWLQRDFGLYIVNLFDTGQASRVLGFKSYGLAYLLKYYCNIVVDKQYQRADWRQRPLSRELIQYAREDTHYLLYIYDKMKNEAISQGHQNNNILMAILNRSRDICLQRYEKDAFLPSGYMSLYNKFNISFNKKQLMVFESLFEWRDATARREDESLSFVMPNHLLFHISQEMPEDVDALFGCCNPVPTLLKANANDVCQIIRQAKAGNVFQPSNPDLNTEPAIKEEMIPNRQTVGYQESKPIMKKPKPVKAGINPEDDERLNDAKYSYTNLLSVLETPDFNQQREYSTPSPVVSTEQMFRQAGWDEIKKPNAQLATENQGLFSKPLQNSLFTKEQESKFLSGMQTVLAISQSIDFNERLAPRFQIPDSLAATDDAMDVELEERIPKNVSEIYQLSNKNRQDKKPKSKKEKNGNQSPLIIQQEDKKVNVTELRNASAKTDPVDFMRDIGWIEEGETIPNYEKPKSNKGEQKTKGNQYNKDKRSGRGGRGGRGRGERNNDRNGGRYQRKY